MSARWLLAVLLLLHCSVCSRAVILEAKSSGRRTSGYLVSWDKEKGVLKVRYVLNDGKTREQELKDKDYNVIISVKPERLEELNKDKPHLYREYAEELESKKADPEAREMALRLYLIAAYLSPQKLGAPCLKSMSNLARSPEEARRFLAMAFLLDPKHDRKTLKPPPVKAVVSESEALHRAMVAALHYFRRGLRKSAWSKANRPGMEEKFAEVPGLMSFEAFKKGCRSSTAQQAAMTDEQLTIILRLELAYGGDSNKSGDSGWSRELMRKSPKPLPVLKWSTLTEFDPKKCHYRDGQWVEP